MCAGAVVAVSWCLGQVEVEEKREGDGVKKAEVISTYAFRSFQFMILPGKWGFR